MSQRRRGTWIFGETTIASYVIKGLSTAVFFTHLYKDVWRSGSKFASKIPIYAEMLMTLDKAVKLMDSGVDHESELIF